MSARIRQVAVCPDCGWRGTAHRDYDAALDDAMRHNESHLDHRARVKRDDDGERHGAYAIQRVNAPTRPEPNATVAEITCEVRIYWPPGTSRGTIIQALTDTVADAAADILRQTPDEPWPPIEGRSRMNVEDYDSPGDEDRRG